MLVLFQNGETEQQAEELWRLRRRTGHIFAQHKLSYSCPYAIGPPKTFPQSITMIVAHVKNIEFGSAICVKIHCLNLLPNVPKNEEQVEGPFWCVLFTLFSQLPALLLEPFTLIPKTSF